MIDSIICVYDLVSILPVQCTILIIIIILSHNDIHDNLDN